MMKPSRPQHLRFTVRFSRKTLLLVLCLAPLGQVHGERAYVTDHDGQPAEPTVAVDNVCAWPNLTVLRDGTIIATIFNQPCHGTSFGDIECWASGDGGQTWHKRGTPARHENEHSNRMNVAAGVAGNGDLLVIASGWTGLDPSGKLGKPFRERILAPWVCRSLSWISMLRIRISTAQRTTRLC